MSSQGNASGGIPAPTAPHRVEARGKGHSRRGGNRGRPVSDDIQRTARERQAAWAETGQRNLTDQLTGELERLYDQHRREQAGTLTDPVHKGDPSRWVR